MSRLRRVAASDPGVCYPGQYHNDDVGDNIPYRTRLTWTELEIARAMDRNTNLATTT
jgi:hypothetical protein